MPEPLRNYLEIILQERNWSWALLGMVYLLAAMMVRGWVMAPLVSRAKELEREHWQRIKWHYLRHAALGWFFFLVPLFLLIMLWYQKGTASLTVGDLWVILLACLSFMLSVLSHLQAFGIATLRTLRETSKKLEEKVF